MKFRTVLFVGSALVLSGAIACEDSEPRDTGSPNRESSQSARSSKALDDVRTRADAAFAELEGGRARFESRIGPQPWPDDLPENWPIPDPSKVLANTSQKEGGRLLLVDLPGTPEQALEFYERALERGGYDVSRRQGRSDHPTLLARHGRDEAILTFIGRAEKTRVEILFKRTVRG